MNDELKSGGEEKKKLEGFQILFNHEVEFVEPLQDVHVARLPISGCAWIDTEDGVVLIDTLGNRPAAAETFERIKGKIKYIIYTHGHGDHVSGSPEFMADKPEVIANQYLPNRLDSYKMLSRHRTRMLAQQFNVPENHEAFLKRMSDTVYPTQTFLGEKTIALGGKTFELRTARAETDDVCWVWIPELKAAFIGDLIIGNFPNIGNPWKPGRFALDWAKTLEEVRALNPETVFCNGAGTIYQGQEALDALDANIEVIRHLHDQVVGCLNRDMHISEMIHAVKVPDHLRDNKHIHMIYSRIEFFVYNVYRWYHGYFDGNPAHLLPRPEKEVNSALLRLIGDPAKIVNTVNELKSQNQAQLALQLLDVLIQAQPEHIEARKRRIELLEILGSEDYCLMSRNSWVYFIEKDEEFLRSKGER
ncbi:MAG: MBL fold metallo-hydrolase [Proteobacteria bacterium]|nr:MBL fold metallo-hydrolase [Pseudomonadota bacterium]